MPAPRPATPQLLKRLNEEAVLETIREAAPISRAQISRRAGISKPTVSLALQARLDAGLVREATDGPDGPSYGAVYFEPVAEAALVLGIDLGARFLRGAVSDLSGAIRARRDVEIGGADADRALDAIAELRDGLAAASCAAPGSVDRRGPPARRLAAGPAWGGSSTPAPPLSLRRPSGSPRPTARRRFSQRRTTPARSSPLRGQATRSRARWWRRRR